MSDLGPEARAILRAGKDGDDPTASDRSRMKRKLSRAIAAGGVIGAASAAGTAAESAAAAATAKAVSFAVIGKVLGGVVLAAALGGGVWWAQAGPSKEQSPPSAATQGAERLAPSSGASPAGGAERLAPSASAPATPETPPPAASSEAGPDAPGAAGAPSSGAAAGAPSSGAEAGAEPARGADRHAASTAGARGSAAPSAVASVDPLEDETKRLREAHGALQSGDAEKALKLLDEQQATYANGQLREERAAARVLALCKLGKGDEARAAAAAFLRDHPRSPLADRVRGGCPESASP